MTYKLFIGGIPGGKYVQASGLRAGPTTTSVDTKDGGKITGTVKLPADAGDVRYLSVSAHNDQGQSAQARADLKTGRFTIEGLPDGEWTISAHGWGEGGSLAGTATASTGADIELTLAKR